MPGLAQDKTPATTDAPAKACMPMMPMMDMQKKMQMDMQKENAALDKLVATMNSTDANQKVDAIATVVNKLVQLRKEDKEKMAEMMKACPMIKDMKDKEKKAPMDMPMGTPKDDSQKHQ